MRRISKSDPVFIVELTDEAVTPVFGVYVKLPFPFVFTLILCIEGVLKLLFDTVFTVTSPVKVIVASPETLLPPSIVKVVPLIDTVIGSVISTISGVSISSVSNAGTSRKRIYIEGDFLIYIFRPVPLTTFYTNVFERTIIATITLFMKSCT